MGKITFFAFLLTHIIWSQNKEAVFLTGRIISDINDLEGVYVINALTEEMTITDRDGFFSIKAKEGDILVFSSNLFRENRIVLTPENFSDLNFMVRMYPLAYQLKEVVIKRYDKINATALGIIPEGQKSYTQAERKLRTATASDLSATSTGVSGSADPLLNFLSGRTAMLKKEQVVEKKEQFIKLLERMFSADHFINKLKIPVEYVKGFEYYAVENDKFTAILNSKNKISTEFLLAELAVRYKEIIASEIK
jgi:hypothetical protein